MSLLSQDSLRSDEPDLEAAASTAAASPNLEVAVQPLAPANMHCVTGTFAAVPAAFPASDFEEGS